MTKAGVPVRVGTRCFREGEEVTIVEMLDDGEILEVLATSRNGQVVRRIALDELMNPERTQILSDDDESLSNDGPDVASVVLWAAPEVERRKAVERGAHVREACTGYRSGHAETALPGEPRPPFRPEVPAMARYAAKAAELHTSVRTIQRWVEQYAAKGEAGLISQRAVQPGPGSRTDHRWRETALEVMCEYTDLSTPTMNFVILRTNARLEARYGPGVVKLPCQRTAYKILEELEALHPLFTHSAKRNRDIASRPTTSYSKLHPTRPGEYMLMDTTRLDVYAMDPNTLQWVNAELTVIMDWFSRCIVGLRVTPVSTKAIDAAAALYQTFRPPPAERDWPDNAVWPPHGVPRSVLVEAQVLDSGSVIAVATPAIVPETLIVDHGRIYVGAHLNSVCQRMGISIQPARLRTGRDKGPVERFFKTLRQDCLQALPGYKGQDVYSRGLAPEKDSWFYLDELEAEIRRWIAVNYHHGTRRSLRGLRVGGLRMSPAEKFAAGVARGGYLEVPRDPHLALEFLPVVGCTFQHYGVQWNRRVYRGPGIAGRTGERSPYLNRKRKWPILVNPDDITKVYFRDPSTREVHVLVWEYADVLNGPMSEEQLTFERRLAKSQNRYVDDPLAIENFLQRCQLSSGRTLVQRRMAMRVGREQSSLMGDIAAAVEAPQLPGADSAGPDVDHDRLPDEGEANEFVDDLDEEPDTEPLIDESDYYRDVLEIK